MCAHVLRFCSKAVTTKNNFVLYRENAKAIERRFQGLKVEKLGRVMSLLKYMCQIVDRDIIGGKTRAVRVNYRYREEIVLRYARYTKVRF